ncbi:transcriptional regulator [Ferrimonas balearica]|uniref:winged helix-turn-helix domain-containing protein n=1 Tax=Ferrimonas balearica TaxID=44012 RepID=UPI001C994E6F|nr:winged helix-turn-helix domain-containing protein [Ferrimonas balearica]MBY5992998.1 winged helix-turn-helix domain-containing protein [Ferrimonas balearica]
MNLSRHATLDLDSRELIDHRQNQRHPLSFAELAILQCLLEHKGEVVDKTTLVAKGWPGRVVAQSSLTQCISTLRRKLSDHPEIELKTVPRYGYCLCPAHAGASAGAPASAPTSTSAAARPARPRPARRHRSPGRWLAGAGVLALLATLHLTGLFGDLMARLAWLDAPQLSPLPAQQQTLGQQPLTLHPVAFEGTPPATEAGQHLVNWHRSDALLSVTDRVKAYAGRSGRFDSVALCRTFEAGCTDPQPLNLVRLSGAQPSLDLAWFRDTKMRMEAVTYNKILLDRFATPEAGLTEDVYRADAYYYGPSDNLVRADIRLSLLFLGDDEGQLLLAACFTDALNETTSMRYELSGPFRLKEYWHDGQRVRQFQVEVDQQTFRRPEQLSEEGALIYRQIHKAVLSAPRMTLNQVYQDDHSGVWSLPLWEDTLVWAHRATLTL